MKVFVTGASGYIGGSVARLLVTAGHAVRGLTRDAAKAGGLARLGIAPVIGSLDDAPLLTAEARAADAVINAADSDHRGAAETLITALAGSGRALIHTSGSSIMADSAAGEASDLVHDDHVFDLPGRFTPVAEKAARVAIDRLVLDAAERGVRASVLCNTLIYGTGLGIAAESVQVPTLAAVARRHGQPRHVGRGRNIWSNVHIGDVAALYLAALERGASGFFFVESGEASFHDLTAALGAALGLAPPEPWPIAEAVAELGYTRAMFSYGSNSRVRGPRARAELGFAPAGETLGAWIARAYGGG